MIGKLLASVILRKVVKAVLLSFLTQMAKKSDNKVDDALVQAVKEALDD